MKRLSLILATAAIGFLPAASVLHAQAPSTTPVAPPMLPLLVSYRYWPVQLVQWVGTELPYSMIELDVDPSNSKHPLLYVTLTDRASAKRIHYTDNDGLIAAAAAMGEEAHKTTLAYEAADGDNNGSITSVRFTMADGKPLQWRFVQGTDMSEQGSGLTALPNLKIPVFAYREMGAISAEGTALQIGDVTSTVEVWKEISQPPYFIGYHAAETEGAHTLLFLAGKENWKITASPAALSAGGSWELDEEHGNHRTVHIDKLDGTHIVVTSTERNQPGVQSVLEGTREGDGWKVDRVRFSPVRGGDKHSLTLEFATPLSAAVQTTKLSLLAGKKTTIATGSIAATTTATDASLALTFSDPKWLSGVTMQEQSTATATGMTISAHP